MQIDDGWYPDPRDPAGLRWWADGGWTSETIPAAKVETGPVQSADAVSAAAGDLTRPPAGPRLEGGGSGRRPSRRLGLSLAALVLFATGSGVAALMSPRSGQIVTSDGDSDEAEPARPAVDGEVEPDPSDESAPSEELEVVEFREIDPVDLPWRTTCSEEWEGEAVALVADGDGGLVDEGWTYPSPAYEVRADSVVFGDVTGDGREDAVFETFCLQNASLQWIEVWTHDDAGEPLQLEPTVQFTKLDGTIDWHEVVDGHLRLHSSTGVPWDQYPHLNGYPVQVVTDHTWSGQRWESLEVSRDPESYEGCDDPSSSAEATARCFTESVQRASWQIATTVATTEMVEWLRERPLGPLSGTFAGCGSARLSQQPDRVACFVEAQDGQFAQLDVYEIGSGYQVDGVTFGEGSSVDEVAGTYGSDPYFDDLWDGCADGNWPDCTTLYLETPIGSGYEWFGSTCGGIDPVGTCDSYGDW